MLKLQSTSMILLLALITGLGPLATDMYLPALPALGEGLGVGAEEAQLTP